MIPSNFVDGRLVVWVRVTVVRPPSVMERQGQVNELGTVMTCSSTDMNMNVSEQQPKRPMNTL